MQVIIGRSGVKVSGRKELSCLRWVCFLFLLLQVELEQQEDNLLKRRPEARTTEESIAGPQENTGKFT